MEVIIATGRRKRAIARLYIKEGKGNIIVNNIDYKKYFNTTLLQKIINTPLEVTNTTGKFDLKAHLDGGGISGQADALKLAIARALVKIDAENHSALKSNGLLTRDPRMVERKKAGFKKARKRFQYSKR